jgi:hypothetical protein
MATEAFGERWTCPRCGRSFAARNQTHACHAGDPPALERHLPGRPAAVVETFWAVGDAARACGSLEVVPEKTRVALHARMSFAALIRGGGGSTVTSCSRGGSSRPGFAASRRSHRTTTSTRSG